MATRDERGHYARKAQRRRGELCALCYTEDLRMHNEVAIRDPNKPGRILGYKPCTNDPSKGASA